MKKLFLLLLMACALVSCDVPQARINMKNYIQTTEETRLPIVIQNISINSPEVLEITIDSIKLNYTNEGSIIPASAYLVTTWKLKKDFMVSEEYSNYSFMYDEFSDFENNTYFVELTDFTDPNIDGNRVKYKALWPDRNPFKK